MPEPSGAPPLVALEAVTLLSPEGSPVFRNLSWRLQPGSRWHLRGVGVTAFLRLCCGLAEPQAGRVLLDGLALKPAPALHPYMARAALGYVPSDGGLAVNLSLQDNLALPLRFALNLDRQRATQAARLWLERAGLGALAQQRPHVPGDGQSWLASLARAAAKRSELWLVDRPAGGLDAAAIRAARAILEQVGQDPAVTLLLAGGDWMSDLGLPLKIEAGQVTVEQP